MRNFILTSSSVTDGHPDKLCDRISDAVVDRFLTRDPSAHIMAECAISGGIVFVAAQTQSEASVDIPLAAREIISETGYKDTDFNPSTVTILSSVTPKGAVYANSEAEGAETVNTTVFGFACNHTPEMMPASIVLAHRLAKRLSEYRRTPGQEWIHPDGQAQVAIVFEERKPVAVHGITLFSAIQPNGADRRDIVSHLREAIIEPVLAGFELPLSEAARIMVNPGLRAVTGGPGRHAGLTGRKNDIDCYGSYSRHGGAALSGKDPRRIDRAAAYAARHAAKNVVASGLASECEVQLSYAIGETEPISVEIDTFGTARISDDKIEEALQSIINFDANAILRVFHFTDLPRRNGGQFFGRLAVFGHFGRPDLSLPWEVTDKADQLRGLIS
jgi:S-adenosylmethionine synthetase